MDLWDVPPRAQVEADEHEPDREVGDDELVRATARARSVRQGRRPRRRTWRRPWRGGARRRRSRSAPCTGRSCSRSTRAPRRRTRTTALRSGTDPRGAGRWCGRRRRRTPGRRRARSTAAGPGRDPGLRSGDSAGPRTPARRPRTHASRRRTRSPVQQVDSHGVATPCVRRLGFGVWRRSVEQTASPVQVPPCDGRHSCPTSDG